MKKEKFQEFLTAMNSSDMPTTPCSLCRVPKKDDKSPLIFQWIRGFSAIGVALLFLAGAMVGLLLFKLTDNPDKGALMHTPPAAIYQANTSTHQ